MSEKNMRREQAHSTASGSDQPLRSPSICGQTLGRLLGLLLVASSAPGIQSAAARPPAPGPPQLRIEIRGQAAEGAQGIGSAPLQGSYQREIVDPCLGQRWEWIADPQHPEWPGRLVMVDSGYRLSSASLPRDLGSSATLPLAARGAPLIRAGDNVTVVQETSVLRARFQAVALEPAVAGQRFRVRLLGGADHALGNQGTVVLAQAKSAGEAVWLTAPGKLP